MGWTRLLMAFVLMLLPTSSAWSDGERAILQCGAAQIVADPSSSNDMSVWSARFSAAALDDFVDRGCVQIQQGCNSCVVRYTDCLPRADELCKSADCLGRFCERKVMCTSKRCVAVGDTAPSCGSGFARVACERYAFDPAVF